MGAEVPLGAGGLFDLESDEVADSRVEWDDVTDLDAEQFGEGDEGPAKHRINAHSDGGEVGGRSRGAGLFFSGLISGDAGDVEPDVGRGAGGVLEAQVDQEATRVGVGAEVGCTAGLGSGWGSDEE